jgi:hypothetical protein
MLPPLAVKGMQLAMDGIFKSDATYAHLRAQVEQIGGKSKPSANERTKGKSSK